MKANHDTMTTRTNDIASPTGPLVVKLGGAAVEDAHHADALWRAVVALAEREPAGLVLVHGGGAIVDRRLAALGMVSARRDGVRITTPEQIDEVVATLGGLVNAKVVAMLSAFGATPIGLRLSDAGVTRLVKADHYGFDAGHVGRVEPGDPTALRALLAGGFLPVMSSVGHDAQGRLLNVNADDAAAGVACAIRARALILLTDVPGVLDTRGALLGRLDAASIATRVASGEIAGGMIPKATGALRAATEAGCPAWIAGATDASNLLALALNEGVGTLVLPTVAPECVTACDLQEALT